ELTKAILESGYLKETHGHYAVAGALSSFAIPATLQDSLMARLDRLVSAKGIAQLAAVIGRQFCLCVAASGLTTRCHDITAGVRTISRGRTGVPTRDATADRLHV